MDELPKYAQFADELADVARGIARELFRSDFGVDIKDDATPVTIADRQIESALRDRIASAWPEHGMLGEEHGEHRIDAEWVWVIDPIDGTKAFASGKPLFGTLISLAHRGRPVLGVIETPALEERWSASEGGPALFHGKSCRVRAPRGLRDAVGYFGTPSTFEGAGAPALTLAERVQWTNWQCDCYAYGLLASGHVDLVVEHDLTPYDFAALVPVIEAAGGVVVDWSGEPLTLQSDGSIVAATCPALAAEARAVLRP